MSPRAYPTLDLLRVVAVSMTILMHVTSVTSNVPGLRELQYGLWLGVDLFMLISGWLLGGQLFRAVARGGGGTVAFWVKRWMRTLPPYYAMLLILYFGGSTFMAGATAGDLALHFLFLQQYVGTNYYLVSWSLCVEEHFYLLLPLVVYAVRRFDRLIVAVAFVFGLELLGVVGRELSHGADHEGIPMQTHLRCHGLFVGVLFAWIAHARPALWSRLARIAPWLGVAGIVAAIAVMASIRVPDTRWSFVFVPTLGTWALALVFIPCVHAECAWSRFRFPGLQYLGELTYSIYLVHAVIPKSWLGPGVETSVVQGLVLRVGFMLGAAVALHHLVERPALRLRRWVLARWFPGELSEAK